MASKAVHYLLYAMLVSEAVLGFVPRWSGNEPRIFFGLLIPPPFAPFTRPAHELIGEIHDWNGWANALLGEKAWPNGVRSSVRSMVGRRDSNPRHADYDALLSFIKTMILLPNGCF